MTLSPDDLVYATDFAPGTLERDFAPESGSWRHVGHGLEGSIDREHAAACWHRERFAGDVALRFEASTVAPHTRDINCYWSGAGTIYGEPPNDCYVDTVPGVILRNSSARLARRGSKARTSNGDPHPHAARVSQENTRKVSRAWRRSRSP